jgi:hypothetical protein
MTVASSEGLGHAGKTVWTNGMAFRIPVAQARILPTNRSSSAQETCL